MTFTAPILDGRTATVQYTVNRSEKSIDSMTCELRAPGGGTTAADCGSRVESSGKTTTYRAALVDLERGESVFSVTVRLSDRGVGSGSVSILIANAAPEANEDLYSVDEDGELTVPAPGVLANDGDADGDQLTVALESGSASGTLVLNPDGSFGYSPSAQFNGVDSFTYRAHDGNGGSAVGTVTVTVSPVNDAPEAAGDVYEVDEDTPLVVPAPGVLGNDVDVDGDQLSAIGVEAPGAPAGESVAVSPDGSLSFSPAPDFAGSRTLQYRISDGAIEATASIDIAVRPVNDAPVAVDDLVSATAGTPLVISAADLLVNDSDVDGPGLSVVSVENATDGTAALEGGAITATPGDGVESMTFGYTVSDGDLSASALVTIRLTPPPPTVEELCAETGGAYSDLWSAWRCFWNDHPEPTGATLRSAFQPACPAASATWTIVSDEVFPRDGFRDITVVCPKPATLELGEVCLSLGQDFGSQSGALTCGDFGLPPTPTVLARLGAPCDELGGESSVVEIAPQLGPPLPTYRYRCAPTA
ncbi:cadherin-like domain-containing protein [Agromyces sp. GXS1127]|uniref:cadherin-like domain-containing protein n=1 Tax=Agromyces sp. GXS1127 TaxID=3424181 RepID=UPI003D319446